MVATVAFYALTIYGGFFTLSVLPCLFKPWSLGVKMYMPLNLPTDDLTIKQLTYMQAFLAVGMLNFVGMFVLSAFYMLTKTFVIFMCVAFTLGIVMGTKELKGAAGVDPKAMGAQIVIQAVFTAALLYSVLTEDYDEVQTPTPTPDVSSLIYFMGGFNILANFAGIFVPVKLLEGYMPNEKMRPADKYGETQLALYVRFVSWANTSAGVMLILIAGAGINYAPFVVLQCAIAPIFVGFFIAFMKGDLGFDDKAMLFWTIYISATAGYFALAAQLYYFA